MIGCGGVGRALLELWKLEHFPVGKLTVIEPRQLPSWTFQMYPQLSHIRQGLNKSNLDSLLVPLLILRPFIVDVSVEVDALKVMSIAAEYKCHYINTSVESWEDKESGTLNTHPNALIRRSLAYRQRQAKRISSRSSLLSNMGANPGLISALAMKGLHDYTLTHGDETSRRLLESGKYSRLSHRLGLRQLHISEIDTQVSLKTRSRGHFYNTWSCVGFQAEALDPVQIGEGSDLGSLVRNEYTYHNMRILPVRGVDMKHKSLVVDSNGETLPIRGYMIPHAEADSLSRFLTYRDYRPTVFYVYQCGVDADKSLQLLKRRQYKSISSDHCHVLENPEIASGGYDSLGALLIFENAIWWTGTVLSIEQVRELGFRYSGPTTVQVATSIHSAIKHLLERPRRGVIEPENLDWKYIIEHSRKYLGNLVSKRLK